MTEISAKIVLDSISPDGIRLSTVQMRYPRFIHAELMTHRAFSRNARSSRAVPVAKMIQEVVDDPAVPLFWGKNQPGMQASEECNEPIYLNDEFYGPDVFEQFTREEAWLEARDQAVKIARGYATASYHKQVVNRLLEPFMHIDVLVTSTDWANFLALRAHQDAEPHIEVLAQETKKALEASTPTLIHPGTWHLPYIVPDDWEAGWVRLGHETHGTGQVTDLMKKISAARCARISYTPFDGNGSIEKELQRYDQLITNQPVHASPVEHQATPDTKGHYDVIRVIDGDKEELVDSGESWDHPKLHGNLYGWIQFRKTIKNEAVWDAHYG